MPLHDAVEVNCKNGATTENQGVCSYCVCCSIVCVFVRVRVRMGVRVCIDMTTSPWWREKVLVSH